eukprot:6087150-Prymnesium_polylepis.1
MPHWRCRTGDDPPAPPTSRQHVSARSSHKGLLGPARQRATRACISCMGRGDPRSGMVRDFEYVPSDAK